MDVRLYTIPASHPGMAVQKMLEAKAIEYRRQDLIPVLSKPLLRVLGFPGTTIPAARIKGRAIQGSAEISRELDRLVPEPALYPGDPEHRLAVEEIERFADRGLQHPVRQILWWALKRRRKALKSFAAGSRLGIPIDLAVKTSAPLVEISVRCNGATDANVRDALAGLPGLLNRVDDWIAEGWIGRETPNAADFQVAASLRLAMTLDDLHDSIAATPCGRLAMDLIPAYPGRVPPVLPAPWLEPLEAATSSPI